MYKRFSAMFTITENPAKVVIPETFATKVKGWLGGNEKLFNNVKDQVCIYFCNSIFIFYPLPPRKKNKQTNEKKKKPGNSRYIITLYEIYNE